MFSASGAKKLGLQDEKLRKLELASEEALVNVISYAYSSDSSSKKLMIECPQRQGFFEVLIKDFGKPFDPIDLDVHVDTHLPIERRAIGGLGIFMIRQLLDEVSYQRVDDYNLLRMAIAL